MGFGRRQFLSLVGAGALGGAFWARRAALAPDETARLDTASLDTVPVAGTSPWASVRDEFLLDRDKVHLACMLIASHPRAVRDAIERHRAALDRDPAGHLAGRNRDEEDATRAAAGEYLEVDGDDVALTGSTTMGLGLLYGGIRLREGDEALTSTYDYYSTKEALRLRARRSGVRVREVDLFSRVRDADEDELVERLVREIRPETRLVATTWVHSSTGLKIPIRRIADELRRLRGDDPRDKILLAVDGVHGFGVEEEGPAALGCDFFVAGCHKWLFGPRGTGILWGRPEAWPLVDDIVPTFSSQTTFGRRFTPGGFHAFEHWWALAEAFRFHLDLGKDLVRERTHELASAFKSELAKIPAVSVVTPLSEALSAGIVCFDVDGMTAQEVVDGLAARGVNASVTPYDRSHARFSVGILNDEDDLERTMRALRALV